MSFSNCTPTFTFESKFSLTAPADRIAGIDVINPVSREENGYVSGSMILIITLAGSDDPEMDVIRAVDTLGDQLNRNADRCERLLDSINVTLADDYSWLPAGRDMWMVPIAFTGDYPADEPQDPDWWRSLITDAPVQLSLSL